MLVLLEAWCADIANRTLLAVDLFNIGVEDAAFEVLNLLARIYFAQIPEVVEANEFVGCFPHRVDIKPAFPSTAGE